MKDEQDRIYHRDPYVEFTRAMRRLVLGLRRGKLSEVKEWLPIAERLLRMHATLGEIHMAGDRREAWREEQPHRQKALELRARFPR